MRIWPALLLAPLLALLQQSLLLMLEGSHCASGSSSPLLQGISLACMLATLGATLLAATQMRECEGERQRFLAQTAVGVGALSTLVCGALWLPQWWLPTCQS